MLRSLAFLIALGVSIAAVNRMNSVFGLIVTAPGYLVQAWLFKRHWALGGPGYRATLIVVSTLFWTLFVLVAAWSVRLVASRRRKHTS